MLEGGKHAFVEKPIAMNSVELQKLVSVANKSGKFVQEAIFSRFCPALVKAKQLVQQGDIGQVQHIQADFGVRDLCNFHVIHQSFWNFLSNS